MKSVAINPINLIENKNVKLINNEAQLFSLNIEIPTEINQTFPYWLNEKGSLGMYKVTNTDLVSLPETPRAIFAEFTLNFNGVSIPFSKEIVYKYNDPVKGEVYQPFEILPEISASFKEIFLGSKEPTPPAIIILGAEKIFPLFVFTIQVLFSCFISSTLCPR